MRDFRRLERADLRAPVRAAERSRPLRLGSAPLLLRVGPQERHRVRAMALLESVVLRRQRAVAEPPGRAAQPDVSTGAPLLAAPGDEAEHRPSLLDRIRRHAPAPAPGGRRAVPPPRHLSVL